MRVGLWLNSIGGILLEDGAPEEALGVFEESLEIAKINYGEESVQSAACYGCLGDVFSELEDYEVAEENYLEGIKILTVIGSKNAEGKENLIELMMQLARLLQKQGKNLRASLMLQDALRIGKETYDEEHPRTFGIIERLQEIN